MGRHDELQEWKDRLNVAHNKFKVVEPKIDRAWNYYRGNQWITGNWSIDQYNDKPIDNVVFANLRAIVPRLNFKNPKINVRPKKKPFRIKDGVFNTLAASASLEIILNYYYKTLQVKREARKCLYDALLSPYGIMELGYTLKTEKVKDDELLEVNELISEDNPFCMRRDIKDFRSDPEGTDPHMNDARWIALRWIKNLDDLKKDDKYSNTTNLKCNYKMKMDFMSATKREDVNPNEDAGLWGKVEGWTIYDKKTERIMDMVDDHSKFLRNEKEWPLEIDGFPVETLYFNENSGDNMPIPDTWQYLDMQDELNRISSMQLDHIRRISQRRYVTRTNAFTPEEMFKLRHGGDGTIVETAMALADSIMPIQDATISQDIYMIRQGLKATIREMAGVSSSEAMVSQKFESATEPALLEQASKTLRGDQQATFENFLVRIIEKLAMIVQDTADEISIPLEADQMTDKEIQKLLSNKLAKIDGVDGAMVLLPWLQIEKNDIKGDYIYEIEIGSTLPSNEETEKRDAVNLYQLMAQNPYIRKREGTKEVLLAFKRPDPDKLLMSDQEVQQISMANMKAQVERELAVTTTKQQTDLAKTQMKTQTTKEVTAMKLHGDNASQQNERESHVLDMKHSHEKHVLDMAHERDKQGMSVKAGMMDLIKQAKMGDLKIDEAEKMKELNLQTALKKSKEPKEE
jgi:hypothetical protein